MDPTHVPRLHATLAAVCPILSVSSGPDLAAPGAYTPADAATEAELDAADAALAAFDYSQAAQDAWLDQTLKDEACTRDTTKDPDDQFFRELSHELHDQLFTLEKKHNNAVTNPNHRVPEIPWKDTVDRAKYRVQYGTQPPPYAPAREIT